MYFPKDVNLSLGFVFITEQIWVSVVEQISFYILFHPDMSYYSRLSTIVINYLKLGYLMFY